MSNTLARENNSMEQTNDQWLWVIDDQLIDSLARYDTLDPASPKRTMQSPALAKALSLNMEGKTEQALSEVTQAIDSGEALPELHWTKAHLEFQLGQYEAALAGYQKVIEQQPNHKAATYNVAVCMEKMGRFDEALEQFVNVASWDPKLAEAALGQGVVLLHLSRPADALSAFEHCLEVKPGHEKALYGKAVALQLLNRTEEAMQLYLKLLPITGPNPELLSNLIGAELARGEALRETTEAASQFARGAGRLGRGSHRARRFQSRRPARRSARKIRFTVVRGVVQSGRRLSEDQPS